MNQLSAIIITFNEERNIARCLQSLAPVADEVIVVDSFSTDRTVEIARSMGATVIQHPFAGYGPQKNVALRHTLHDWILNLDADEALSEELTASLLRLKEEAAPAHPAYRCNILPNYCGRWIYHCGWYPAPKVRIWNKRQASMNDDKVHEGILLHAPDRPIGFLRGDILHYSFHTISDHVRKIEQYSEIGARFDVERGKRCSLLKLWLSPKWEFLATYVLRRGFLDGYYGYVISKNSAIASYVKYLKIRQYTALRAKGLPY